MGQITQYVAFPPAASIFRMRLETTPLSETRVVQFCQGRQPSPALRDELCRGLLTAEGEDARRAAVKL